MWSVELANQPTRKTVLSPFDRLTEVFSHCCIFTIVVAAFMFEMKFLILKLLTVAVHYSSGDSTLQRWFCVLQIRDIVLDVEWNRCFCFFFLLNEQNPRQHSMWQNLNFRQFSHWITSSYQTTREHTMEQKRTSIYSTKNLNERKEKNPVLQWDSWSRTT